MELLKSKDILKTELSDRVAANPSYSLRAMARQVKVSPSLLSDLLRGKKKLSASRALEVAKALKFDKKRATYFSTLVAFESAKTEDLKVLYLERLSAVSPKPEAKPIDLDRFRVLSDWYHVPILELAQLDGFEMNSVTIADYLGISKIEAETALDRLMRMGLLKVSADGKYNKSHPHLVFNSELRNEALRTFHEQMLKKAIESIRTQTPNEKFIGSETLALSEDQLKTATEYIEECFSKIVHLATQKSHKKKIYHLGIQLFHLQKKEGKK